jgi:hypothetical protein
MPVSSAAPRNLESIFGTLEVTRTRYQGEDTPGLHCVGAASNLAAHRYSLEVRRRVAIEANESVIEDGVQTFEAFTGRRFLNLSSKRR